MEPSKNKFGLYQKKIGNESETHQDNVSPLLNLLAFTNRVVGLFFLPAPFTIKAMGKALGKMCWEKKIICSQQDLKLRYRIPDNHMVSRNTNGMFIMRRRIPYDRQGRNHHNISREILL